MADFAAIHKGNSSLLERFRKEKQEAIANAAKRNLSANKVQKVFRGILGRMRIRRYNVAALEIERVFRGNVGRRCCRKHRKQYQDYKLRAKFNYFVIYIQRCFRGYYSRKYKQNYASRKKYVESVVATAAHVRQQMANYHAEQTARIEAKKEKEANDEFVSLAQNLHHLVGTRHIRGIYNPPPNYMNEPTAQAVPIEDHLRGIVKDLLRSTGRTRHRGGLVMDVNGTRKIPYKGLKNKLSIQASAPYDTMEQESKREKMLHKMLRTDKNKDFLTYTKPTQLLPKPRDANKFIDPFLDKWANPFFTKGVPRDQAQLEESVLQRKALFALPTDPDHNWYNSVKGNKSTALSNDLFDVIGDATLTGGSSRRHTGRTQRFGLADSSDNRGLPTSSLPAPPLKDTKVLYGSSGIYWKEPSPEFNVSAGMSTRKQQESIMKSMEKSAMGSSAQSPGNETASADLSALADQEVAALGMGSSPMPITTKSSIRSQSSPSVGSPSRVAFARSPIVKKGKQGTMQVKVRGLVPLGSKGSPQTEGREVAVDSSDEEA